MKAQLNPALKTNRLKTNVFGFLLLLVVSLGFISQTQAQEKCAQVFADKETTSTKTLEETLETVLADRSLPSALRSQVASELGRFRWFHFQDRGASPRPETKQALAQLLKALPLSTSPANPSFRKALMMAIPSSFAPAEAFQLLLPFARGVLTTEPTDIFFANAAIKKLGSRLGSFPVRFDNPSKSRTSAQSILLHEPIVSVETLGGGWNETYLVKFQSGHFGVFKPFVGQKNMGPDQSAWKNRVAFVRETTAVSIVEDFLGNRVSREQGHSKITVPETQEILLVHNGVSYGLGSVQLYVHGVENASALQTRAPQEWSRLLQSKEWSEFEVRGRILDYVLGNPDRFEYAGFRIPHYAASNYNNIMIPKNLKGPSDLQFVLIDNAFGRPGLPDFSAKYLPDAKQIPGDLARAIMNFDEAAFRKQFRETLPEDGVNDVILRIHELQSLLRSADLNPAGP